MRAYKGFIKTPDGKLKCRDMIYEVGEKYVFDGEIELCLRGYHACHELIDCCRFYPQNMDNVYYEVECGGDIIESESDDGKFVCSEITLVKEADMSIYPHFERIIDSWNGYRIVAEGRYKNIITPEKKLLLNEWCLYIGVIGNTGFFNIEIRFGMNRKSNVIDTSGKLLYEEWFDNIVPTTSGRIWRVYKNTKENFFNDKGVLIFDTWFDDTGNFISGWARVFKKSEYNYINEGGKLMFDTWVEKADNFDRNGTATVKIDGRWRRINNQGEFLW